MRKLVKKKFEKWCSTEKAEDQRENDGRKLMLENFYLVNMV